ncbi:MAG: tRNA (N6-threonylcarbamoyladenosine(37)-N6)-methyltransferase TrmO [bacterium]|nr:tRNA (N6-threonylcarbamoyladenosine(37)-N6)-methyltransferase TrmO [bacterium]
MHQFKPIGFMEASQQYKYQQPRQGQFANNEGKIVLVADQNFEQALEDISGFSKIWLIYVFHQNDGWRPKVDPPVCPDGIKKGLFATRSPYRPNPIGLSCVDLVSVKGREITIANFDLLHGTPILDIKPYVRHYDSYPNATTGWLPEKAPRENGINFSQEAEKAALWLMENQGPDLFDLARVQLAVDPCNGKRKRVRCLQESQFELAFRTWRLIFQYAAENFLVEIVSIRSGYGYDELDKGIPDPYNDKELHRKFNREFNSEF